MSKRRDRPYRAGRSPDWVKVKNRSHPSLARVEDAFSEAASNRPTLEGQCPFSSYVFYDLAIGAEPCALLSAPTRLLSWAS